MHNCVFRCALRSASLLAFFLITLGCGSSWHDPNATHGSLSLLNSPPSITALSPDSAPVNSVVFTMEVDGANFGTDAIVFWNGNPLSTRFVNSQRLFADLTSTNLMFSGMVQVYLRTGGLNSNTVEFNLH